MKPAARIQSAIEILQEILQGAKPADTIITDYFKVRRYAGSKDRRAINQQVYDILRQRARLTWLADQNGLEHTARNLVLMDCVSREDDIAALFTGDQYAPAGLSETEAQTLPVLAEHDLSKAPDHIRLEYPHWLEEDLKTSLGNNFEPALQALNQEACLDLRINSLQATRAQVQELLSKQNIETETCPYSPLGLRSHKKVKLGGIQAYKNGLVDVQDEGSQLIAQLCEARDQELVMDFCAGAGGKTLALAADMKNKGILYALDIAAKRLFRMRRRLERAGVQNVTLHPINSEADPWLKQFERRVDRLLIDAPCSGIGTWRRAPESRWKLTPEQLDDFTGRQARILKNAAHLVKPGGRLIYATCSLLKRENEDQVARFLNEQKDYSLRPVQDAWAERLNSPCPFDGPYMIMRSDQHHSDGFFCAILERH